MPKARIKIPLVKLYNASELRLQARFRLENAGRWVAWSMDMTRIVASGDDPESVHEAAARTGEPDVIYEWVPPVSERKIEPGA